MSVTDTIAGDFLGRASRAGHDALSATVLTRWADAECRWRRLADTGAALAFQRAAWLEPWYRHFARGWTEPLIVFVSDPRSGRDLLALPLVRQSEGLKRVVTFADGGLSDYNAPVLADGYCGRSDAGRIWAAIRKALRPADVIRFEKMPVEFDGRTNPLALARGATRSRLTGNVLHVPGSWDEWHWSHERTRRKEMERLGRVFDRQPGSAFHRCGPGPDADRILEALKSLQAARIAELDLPYILDSEPARSFYDTIAQDGLRNGTAVLTALTIGPEVVAALLGIADGKHYAMTRLATPGPKWKSTSAGRVLIERTMRMLHQEGYRAFDFTIGAYDYKRRFGVTPVPLVDVTLAQTPLGWHEMAHTRTKAALRRNSTVMRVVRRFREGRNQDETSAEM